ncbi:arginine--tRNA ligase [Patescibacteria group bacterium]|nr:arginine--tRNA ligase [Patescibacteria group bacterium]
MITLDIRKKILQAAKQAFPQTEINEEDINLEHPGLDEHGDYSTNIALRLGKQVGMKPVEVAKRIVQTLSDADRLWQKVEIAGPGFINFTLSTATLVDQMEQALKGGERYGSSEHGQGLTMVIDYSAPNIAKRFGIGHLRSTIIGHALYNLYQFQGYKTIGDNHLGDWGTQFGKILYMIETEKPKELTVDKLEELYVKFHQLAEADPKLEEKGREWFKKLEDGEPKARELWKKCVEVSMAEFNRIYALLGVKIDYAYGESFYEKEMPGVIADAKAKGLAKQSDGATIIEIPGLKAPLLLVKSDGTTTYATRDLATLKFRKETWNPDLVIYEVGAEQALHFQQVFVAAKMLGYLKPGEELRHTKHGLYRLPSGKFSTRKGNTPKLEEILDEAIDRAKKLGSQDQKTAEAVGIGAIKYFDLMHSVQSDIIFDWEKMFNLQGDSGPYLQYSYARARSVLRKAGLQTTDYRLQKNNKTVDSSQWSVVNEELAVLRYLYRFPEVVEAAARSYSPNLVAGYLFELAKRYNNFYNSQPIIGNDFRLALTAATAIVLKNGLNLLGIEVLDKM